MQQKYRSEDQIGSYAEKSPPCDRSGLFCFWFQDLEIVMNLSTYNSILEANMIPSVNWVQQQDRTSAEWI